jgi:hypothetical protein
VLFKLAPSLAFGLARAASKGNTSTPIFGHSILDGIVPGTIIQLIGLERPEAMDSHVIAVSISLPPWLSLVPDNSLPSRIHHVGRELPVRNASPDLLLASSGQAPVVKLDKMGFAKAAAVTVDFVLACGEHIIPFLMTRNVRGGEVCQSEPQKRSQQ